MCSFGFTKNKEEVVGCINAYSEKNYKNYANQDGILDISFTADEGDVVAVIGPNGAGKSTC